MELLKPFGEIGKDDASIAGGKGASLGEMTQAGIPVPPGFVVLAPTFDRFLAETDLNVEVDSILSTVNHAEMHTVENASEKIQTLIHEAKMPEDIAAEVMSAFKELGAKFVAVRSSATAEDGSTAAWAGQLDTYLNTTEEEVLRNVQRCWASLFTPRAIFYRFEKGMHADHISVAVVVQKMVQSDASGIAFSVHPVTEDRNQLIIEASWGLGEAIVSGQVTPDSYVVTKSPRTILDKNIATKERGIFGKDGGGNEWREVAAEKREIQTLTDDEILALSEAVIGIENHYGFPCDIEWAVEAGKIYITQSRPITTLSSASEDVASNTPAFPSADASSYIAVTDDWYRSIARPNLLLDASMFLDIYRDGVVPGAKRGFEYQVLLYKKGFSNFYRSKGQIEDLLKTDLLAAAKDKEAIREYAKKGLEAFAMADRCIEGIGSADSFEKLQGFGPSVVDAMRKSIQYGTLVPYWIMNAVEKEGAIRENPGDFAHIFEEFDVLRADSRNVNMRELVYEKMWVVLAKHFGETDAEVFSSLTHPEFTKLLETGEKPDMALLRARHAGCVVWYPLDSKELSYSFDQGVYDTMFRYDAKDFSGTEITGSVAQKGIVQGHVKILFTNADGEGFKDGDIVVSTSTSPNLMPFLMRCGAIVTDEGGIASHAAIVSRELKKPCVIGTKVATQVLKDGDLVEVDADAGVIRILKPAAGPFDLAPAAKTVGVSIDTKGIDPSAYRYYGLWKCNLFADWFWTSWLVPELAKEIGLGLEDGGILVLNGGNFFVKKSTMEAVRAYAKDLIESNDREKLEALKRQAHRIYDESLATARKHSSREAETASVRNIAEAGRAIMFPWCFGYLLSEVFDEFLIPAATKEGIAEQDISSLIPSFETPLSKAQENLRSIKSLLVERGHWDALLEDSVKGVSAIRADGEALARIEEHAREYGWTTILNLVGDDPSVEEVIDQITHLPAENHVDAPQVPENLAFLIACASTTAYLRQTGVEYFSIYARYAQTLLKKAAAKKGVEYRRLLDLNLDEIIAGVEGASVTETLARRAGDRWVIRTVPGKEPEVFDDGALLDRLAELMIPKAAASSDGTIQGQVGNKGFGTGTAKVILNLEDFHKMAPGDVLVTTMTTPDFVPLMQKASAIVTDIGGLLCHAAIISRELNIPCVIGTKFATQLLKDGDTVEVDATKAVVKIIAAPTPSGDASSELVEWIKDSDWDIDWEGPFVLLDVSVASRAYFGTLTELFGVSLSSILISYRDGIASAWLPRKEYEAFGTALAAKASDAAYLSRWVSEFKRQADKILAVLDTSPEDFLERLDEISRLYDTYGAYQIATKAAYNFVPATMPETQESLEGARKYSEKFYKLSAEMFDKVAELVAKRTDGYSKEMVQMMSYEEVKSFLHAGAIPSKEALLARHKRSAALWQADGMHMLSGDEIDAIQNYWMGDTASGKVSGTSAYPGKIIGKVRVIRNYRGATLEEGEVLVTGMTDPNFLPLMHTAAAIVTDGGGMLCHAAITARELKKPCVIGTKAATRAFKDGDLVEVDADTGIVRKISA